MKKHTQWRKSRLKFDVLTRCPQGQGTFVAPYITITAALSPLQDIKYPFTLFKQNFITFFFLPPMPPHVLMNFRGFPSGCGDSVADF